jgi:uncharacterized alpha-E superfamily protein
MLSKVAERVYWTARYLERIESTARLINIYDMLLFDLPRSVKIDWYNLIVINQLESIFNNQYTVRDERNVVKFMLGDESNPSSIVSSLRNIRENVRTTRDVVPEETWELTNELSIYVQDNVQQGINRSKRHNFLENIIKGCQQILGLLYGNMSHDAAWDFLRLGRNLERADMTTRNLDAGIAAILEMQYEQNVVNSQQIIWGNVLRSLNADQSYRRSTRISVNGPDVLHYLLESEEFPRSISHCMQALLNSCAALPGSDVIQKQLEKINNTLFKKTDYTLIDESFRTYLNTVQIQLGNIHQLISTTWFPLQPVIQQQEQTINEA